MLFNSAYPYFFIIMSEDLKNLVQQMCQKVNADVLEVYEVFKDYFGEDRVDLQPYINLEWVESRRDLRLSDHLTKSNVLCSRYFASLS